MAQPHPTNISLLELHLTGIPGLQHLHLWMSFPFCILYLVTLAGNSTLLCLIKADPSLHLPMFLFLSMLAVTDLLMSTSIIPKMLGIFWFRSTAISLDACLTQMYFVHTLSMMESGLLVAMAFDRYVAICNPLRYLSILTSPMVAAIGLSTLLRAVVFMSPLTSQILRLPLCSPAVVDHSYCEHMAMLNLACGNAAFSHTYILSVATYVVSFDSLLIAISYAFVLRAVLSLSSPRASCKKAFSTCGSHLCVMAFFYIPGLLSMYMERYHQELPPHIQVLLADFYLLIPPAFNPLIYGIRTKQIRDGARRVISRRRPMAGGIGPGL
ncbi:PREDICTED: olfactory receptor 52K2-like [Buceros rhinoceros silvestris]|uniref:olfactory receptor 52K2-like n=1 Tax=Buceros rhinoceros silvestris TaxID=175836 RepID=UPI000529478D|nr:PREDICTED: olfactory receptor 52K2-like [Buceros rhinoceros silvestris]